MNTDETNGWIFSPAGHRWMTRKFGKYTSRQGFFTLKRLNPVSALITPWASWDVPSRWPNPFPEHDMDALLFNPGIQVEDLNYELE